MPSTDPCSLSETHRAILRLVATGLSSKEIAKAVSLRPSTVDTYMRQAIRFYGVANRVQAAQRYLSEVPPAPLSTLRPQSLPLAPARDPSMLAEPYGQIPGARSSEAVREVAVEYQADAPLTAPPPPPTAGETDDARSAFDTLIKIAAFTAALVIILSAAEPLGRGFETLAHFILELRHQ